MPLWAHGSGLSFRSLSFSDTSDPLPPGHTGHPRLLLQSAREPSLLARGCLGPTAVDGTMRGSLFLPLASRWGSPWTAPPETRRGGSGLGTWAPGTVLLAALHEGLSLRTRLPGRGLSPASTLTGFPRLPALRSPPKPGWRPPATVTRPRGLRRPGWLPDPSLNSL